MSSGSNDLRKSVIGLPGKRVLEQENQGNVSSTSTLHWSSNLAECSISLDNLRTVLVHIRVVCAPQIDINVRHYKTRRYLVKVYLFLRI